MNSDMDQKYFKNNLFEFIQKGSLDGVWYWDMGDADNLWMNPKLWEALGYNSAEKKHQSIEWQDVIFQDDLKVALDNFHKYCENHNHPYDQIIRYRRNNGPTVWIRFRGIAIMDENGKPVKMLGTHSDLTDIKEKEERADILKQRLELIFNGTHDSMALISVQKNKTIRYEMVNKAFLNQFALSEDQVIGKSPQNVFGNKTGAKIIELYSKCIENREPLNFEEVIELSGSVFYFQTTVVPADGPDIEHLIVSKKDITELKRSIADFQREKNNIDAIFESSPVAMLAVDESIKIISVNKAAVELCGGNISNVLHHRPGDAIRCLHSFETPQGCGFAKDCPICPIRKVIEGLITGSGGKIHRVEMPVTIVRNEGPQNIWLDVGAEAIFVDGKRIICIALDDITERKKLENDLIVYQENLERTNKALNDRLEQTLKTLSKIGEIRDLYTAGHQKRVKELACAIALELGLSEEKVMNISYGAQIHDVGKVFIASEILNKPGRITDLEYKLLQTHVENGYNVVREIDFPSQIHSMIYQHHERLDGSGYPQGLSGDEIILESRILAVADIVEAISSNRPYRPALGIDAALDEIQLYKGIRYDADVVDVCVGLFREKEFQFYED